LRNPAAIWRRARERREETDEGLGGFIGEGLRGGGARVSVGEAHRRAAVGAVLAQVFLPEEAGRSDRWTPPIGGRRRGREYPFRWKPCWAGAESGSGRLGFPLVSFIFFVLLSFSFSDLPFLLLLLQ
jgi:hypothetical protein